MKIVLFVYRLNSPDCLGDWEWMERHPMGGSEASAFRMGAALRELGHDVHVTNDPRALAGGCDIFVSLRHFEIFQRPFRAARASYLWCTDDADQPLVAKLRDARTAALVYSHLNGAVVLSEYQRARWAEHLHLPAEKTFVSANGIPTQRWNLDPSSLGTRKPWLYYGSTPFRGLDRLLSVWDSIRAAVPEAELHVFSSMQIYGVSDPPEFAALYERAKTQQGVHYQGAQGQAAIREIARQCRLLAYPCVFPETSCITVMEAMAAGCAVVTTALGALPETAAGNILIPPDNPRWLETWRDEVIRLLKDDEACQAMGRRNLAISAGRDWLEIARSWVARFETDLQSAPRR